MSDNDFLNMEGGGDELPLTSPPSKHRTNIIERTLMTIQKIRIYPNGQAFIASSKSWFDRKGTVVKKKQKKIAEMKESKIGKSEVY